MPGRPRRANHGFRAHLSGTPDRSPQPVRRGGRWILLAVGLLGAGWPDVQVPIRTTDSARHDAALVIGLEQHRSLPTVPYARRDADAFAQWLRFTHGVPSDRVTRLNDPPTSWIELALDRTARKVGPEGTLWVYVAGHGIASRFDGRHYLLGRDDDPDEPELSVEHLQEVLAQTDAGRVLLVLDVSFSGLARTGEPLVEGRRYTVPPLRPPDDPRVASWVAAGPAQIAGPLEATRQGLFTWHVLAALRGFADGVFGDPDGLVSLEEAQVWVQRRLQSLERDQTPSRDPRPGPRAWVLGVAHRRAPEGLDALDPGPAPTPPEPDPIDADATPEVWSGPTDDEIAEARAELRRQFQAKADAAWSEAFTMARTGAPQGRAALDRFLQRFGSVTYVWHDQEFVFTAEQVPEARRMLMHGGRPVAALVDDVYVAPGTVWMGTPAASAGHRADEVHHEVTITRPLRVARTEVTQQLYTTVMGEDPSTHDGRLRPVETLTWVDAVRFCNQLSRLDGYLPVYEIRGARVRWNRDADGWRLPTEAEWTLLAGGTRFPGRPSADAVCKADNIGDTSLDDPPSGPLGAFTCDDGHATTAPVNALRPDGLGLRGLAGNVAEWTWDAYRVADTAPQTDPAPDQPLRWRVVKGGSYLSDPADVRTGARAREATSTARPDLGLRVVRTVEPPTEE